MTRYDIDTLFKTIIPTQGRYESYNINADVKKFKDIGDASRIAMILQADASVRSLASWLSLPDLAGDKLRINMTAVEGEIYDSLIRNLTHVYHYFIQNILFCPVLYVFVYRQILNC